MEKDTPDDTHPWVVYDRGGRVGGGAIAGARSLGRALGFCLLVTGPLLYSQTDTTRHGWPVQPFNATHPITGVFGEFRNTLSSDHFHNGVDIPGPDGSPVYSVYDGVVTSIGTVASSGTSAFVRVRYTVSGLVKSDAYVHIEPNPLLRVGDPVVAYQTVLGTILSGQGHVHFTHGYVGAELNAIRPEGGLTPYVDIYPPRILSVRLFVDGTEIEFTGGRVSGNVDIRVHIAETNAASPADVRSSTSNNGTYTAGYRVLSADRSSVVYEPPSAGERYRFDTKPDNSQVHNVFATGSDVSTHIYTITNGGGSAAVNATKSVPNGFWNAAALADGEYTLQIWAGDTRGLADTVYRTVNVMPGDPVPPAIPVLRSVENDAPDRITVRWYPNGEPDLRGYRLSFSFGGRIWTDRADENTLRPSVSEISFDNIRSGTIFFRLSAVDSASPPNVSPPCDVYGVRLNSTSQRALVVDGFDRTGGTGSWQAPIHSFGLTHGLSIPTDFGTCANEAVMDGSVSMGAYDIVVWVLGDESSSDETFSQAEQALVRAYLNNGGRLLVSGSEVGYDLGRASGPTAEDREFLGSYLKSGYVADDSQEYTVNGSAGTPFAGLQFRYGVTGEGSPYEEDWPDVLAPAGGSIPLLWYGQPGQVCAGTGYLGPFPGGGATGGVVLLGFPFETITTRAYRDSVMRAAFSFLNAVTAVPDAGDGLVPDVFVLEQNYPNPFNPATTIRFTLPQAGPVRLTVYDLLGRVVAVPVDEWRAAGSHEAVWNAGGVSSGVYFYSLTAGGESLIRTMMVLR